MSRKGFRRGRVIPALFFTFAAGLAVGWFARVHYEPSMAIVAADVGLPAGIDNNVGLASTEIDNGKADVSSVDRPSNQSTQRITTPQPQTLTNASAIDALAGKDLQLPIDHADLTAWKGQFGDERDRGVRAHEAVDILAPRGTPVHAVESGTIEKLFLSRQGGITAYQFDRSKRFCYYYAHLERYAPGLREKQAVSQGDVIGYVGTTGNAPPNTPHLHFAIFELTPDKHWWQGKPIDPWLAYTR